MPAPCLPEGHRINDYKHLMTRVEAKQLDALFDIEKEPQSDYLHASSCFACKSA